MADFQDRFAEFRLNDELKAQFLDFETIWRARELAIKSYRVITIVNSDTTDSELESQGGDNAELA
jgi:hypothetical protein